MSAVDDYKYENVKNSWEIRNITIIMCVFLFLTPFSDRNIFPVPIPMAGAMIMCLIYLKLISEYIFKSLVSMFFFMLFCLTMIISLFFVDSINKVLVNLYFIAMAGLSIVVSHFFYTHLNNKKSMKYIACTASFVSISIFVAYPFFWMKFNFFGFYQYNFLFDDKSHLIIYCFFILFILLTYIPSMKEEKYFIKIIVYLGVFCAVVSAFFTGSRLFVFFFPVIIVLWGRSFFVSKKSIAVSFAVLIVLSLVLIYSYDAEIKPIQGTINLILTAGEGKKSLSTLHHIVMLDTQIHSRFSSIINFFFGTGIGGFGSVVLSENDNYRYLTMLQYGQYYNVAGYLPPHSVWGWIISELSIFGIILILFPIIKIIINSIKNKNYLSLAYIFAVLPSGLFYHSQNEVYYFMFLALIFVSSGSVANHGTAHTNSA